MVDTSCKGGVGGGGVGGDSCELLHSGLPRLVTVPCGCVTS